MYHNDSAWRWRGRGRVNFWGVWGRTAGIVYLDVLCLIMSKNSACAHKAHIYPEAGSFPNFSDLRQSCIFLTAITYCDSNSREMKEMKGLHPFALVLYPSSYTFKQKKAFNIEQQSHCNISLHAPEILREDDIFLEILPFLQSSFKQTCSCTHI